jgi:hypothetical protein
VFGVIVIPVRDIMATAIEDVWWHVSRTPANIFNALGINVHHLHDDDHDDDMKQVVPPRGGSYGSKHVRDI